MDFILLTGLDNGLIILGRDLLKKSYIKTTDDGGGTAIVFNKSLTWQIETPQEQVVTIGDIHVKETVAQIFKMLQSNDIQQIK